MANERIGNSILPSLPLFVGPYDVGNKDLVGKFLLQGLIKKQFQPAHLGNRLVHLMKN